MAKQVNKGAADAAARLIAKYGKAAVSSAIRNFKPTKKVKLEKTIARAVKEPMTNVRKEPRVLDADVYIHDNYDWVTETKRKIIKDEMKKIGKSKKIDVENRFKMRDKYKKEQLKIKELKNKK